MTAMIDELVVRKFTPLECERLQGLPDNWTLIDDKTCSDSARYKAIGNGMAQPCADFVIQRIADHEGSKHQ
ncbi:DNA cytosine methyltransferase [Megasphaera sp.]|jgi:DNA (cytosine-5)-methyltransferase 1|uniref:DNA cytosine methyltransferase n=1 Tax=Megasphaera sp. TaxID=2023260 RepID=UPI00402A0235